MSNTEGYIDIGTEKLHYLQWGSGSKILLAFHGYGNDAKMFSPLEPYLNDDYTILSFDLPHHGGSKWQDDSLFTKKDLALLVGHIKSIYKVDKVSLAGYSMGGRVCLSIIEVVPASIDKVLLLATDGLTVNIYYYFFTRTWPGKKMFRHMLEHPALYFKIMDLLKKTKLVDAARHKFVMYFLKSEQDRKQLLRIWAGTSDIIPSPGKVKALIKQCAIQVHIYMGAYDKILPPSLAEGFGSGLDTVHLHTLEKGHRVFDHDNAPEIALSLL
ncbi:MAG: hypothetical protein JWQ38_2405 [Flavipsychrobacter sp.]|nr:hypothetical protein [Flavipsychrobacter sp.]